MIRDLIALDNSSRVWVYQADRMLSDQEADEMRDHVFTFLETWNAHQKDLLSYGNIFHHRFLVLFADETQTGASGCSIDDSVRFITKLGEHYNVDFFDRLNYCYLEMDEVKSVSHGQLKVKYKEGEINDESLFFDNLVKTKEEFLQGWVKPLSDSWIMKFCR